MGEKGVSGLTTRSLCETAGISKGNLYHHFVSIDEIIMAACQTIVGEMINKVENVKYRSVKSYEKNEKVNLLKAFETEFIKKINNEL